MRSIRLSMLVYFLGLLVVPLAVASLLVYRSAQRTPGEKEKATAELIEAKYEERFDTALLHEAQALMGRVNLAWNFQRIRFLPNPIAVPKQFPIPISNSVHSLGAITAAFTPTGY